MVKLVLLPLLVALLAMHTSVNAYGVVRVDVQKDSNTVAFANAINNAITSKIQSLNTFWNSLFQAKLAYGSSSGSGSSSGTTTSTNVNYIPIYQKTVRVNSGYVAAAPTSGQVAEKVKTTDVEAAPAPSSSSTLQGSAVSGGSTVVTVNKSFIPSVSVSTSPIGSSTTSDADSAASTATSSNTVGYTYRKRYVSN